MVGDESCPSALGHDIYMIIVMPVGICQSQVELIIFLSSRTQPAETQPAEYSRVALNPVATICIWLLN